MELAERFTVRDSTGNQYVIEKWVEYGISYSGGTSTRYEKEIVYQTPDGEVVNHQDHARFQVPAKADG